MAGQAKNTIVKFVNANDVTTREGRGQILKFGIPKI
jgi:hypothetical protein